jgi:hypothetical protein
MRTKLSARLLVCAALAGSASLAAVVVPGGIASATPLTVTCTHLSGNASSQMLSGCTGSGASGSSEAGTSPAHGTNVVDTGSTSTITWGSGKTSKTTYTFHSVTNNCATLSGYTKDLKEHESGSVKTGSAGGTATGMRGGAFSGNACVYTLTAAPHTLKVVNQGNFNV